MKNELNQLKINLQELNRELTQLQHKLITKSESLCISEIANGRIDEAIREFEALGNQANLSRIITLAYNNYEKVNEVPNIVSFISRSSTLIKYCWKYENAHKALFEIMQAGDNLDSPNLLLVQSSAIRTNCIMNASFKEELNSYSDKIIDTWSNNIRQGKFDQIIIFCQKYPNTCYEYLENLIKKSYANQLGHVKNTIKFAESLSYIANIYKSYSHIFKAMEHNSHLDSLELMILAYKLKQLMENPGYRVAYQKETNQCTYLKEKLPVSVRKLIWGGDKCTIRNEVYQEYLLAATPEHINSLGEKINNKPMFDQDSRYVYTDQQKVISPNSFWKIKHRDSDGVPVFKIYNIKHQEYLYSPSYERAALDDYRRYVFTWRNQEIASDYWEIIPIDNGRAFTIKSTYNQEYLFSTREDQEKFHVYLHSENDSMMGAIINTRTYYDHTKRRVFTWKEKNQKVPEVNWNIDCEEN